MNRRQLRVADSVVLAALVLSCGGGGDSITGPTTGPPSPPAPVYHLEFVAQPAASLAGKPLDLVSVRVADAQGNTAATSAISIAITARNATGSSVALAGVASATAVNGVATFGGLIVTTPGDNLTMLASASGFTAVASAPFSIQPAPVAVDSTLLRLVSDSATQSAGTFVFQSIGAGAPAIDSGQVIVGAQGGGFLRRVMHMSKAGNTITAQTVSASLDEVMQNDSLVVRLASGAAHSLLGGVGQLSTSAAHFQLSPELLHSDTNCPTDLKSLSFMCTVTNLTLWGQAGGSLVLSNATFGLDLNPELVAHWGFLSLKDAHFTVNAVATFNSTFDFGLVASATGNGSIPLGTVTVPFVYGIVVGTFIIPVTLEWSVGADGKIAFEAGWTSSATTTVGGTWSSDAGWTSVNDAHFDFTPQVGSPEVNATLTSHLGLKVKPRVVLYGAIGGDVYAEPYAKATATADLTQNQWSTSCSTGVNLGLDFDFTILTKHLAAYTKNFDLLNKSWDVCAHSGQIVQAPAPTINLSAHSASFAATAGGANPDPQSTIGITNIGTGTLSGLAVGTIVYGHGVDPV